MKARTIEQYKILKWIEYNFVPGTVKVTFDGRKTATITDQTGATATINCTEDGTVYLEISIHAPTGGATEIPVDQRPAGKISIHAPTGGATRHGTNRNILQIFQSTLPRGERLQR